ncbi:MAG TPA: diguanylate cyclase [Clostridiales bacterium]|nr:diguanylate cyclase [Clostridiales bacterium]
MFIYQILLVISILFMMLLLFLIALKSKKKQIHYAVMAIAVSLLTWNISVLCYITFSGIPWVLAVSEKIYFIGIIFASLATLFTSLIFVHTRIRFSWKYALLFVVPSVSLAVLFTNPYHNFFYKTFSLIPSEQDFGFYFSVHTAYSYLCIGIGLFYLLHFSVKNFGFFSRQAMLIFFGILISLIADTFSTFHIFDWSAAVENIVFSVTAILFIFAIVKLDFLNVVPIALHKVVNIISDAYVVFSEEYEIVDFNNAFITNWDGASRKAGICEVIKRGCPDFDEEQFIHKVSKSVREQTTVSMEMQCPSSDGARYYQSEITPVIFKSNHVGTIMLIKDITELKKNLEEVIRLNEKLRSLAVKDWLTQAYNRYFFDERLEQEIDRASKLQSCEGEAAKAGNNLGLIMFDIDYFKVYNDLNGHQAGDELLQVLVNIVKETLFPADILCRYGGEEFAVICCRTAVEGIRVTAEKIRKSLEEHEFKYQDTQPDGNLTVSVGVAYYAQPCLKKDDLIQMADQNLYLAKNTGKNKVVFRQYEDLI